MNVQFLDIPTQCPVCGHPTTIKADPRSGVKTLWCSNPDCGNQTLAKWKHFVSRDAMNMAGIGPAQLQDMLALGIIDENFSSIYQAADNGAIYSLIQNYEGYGDTKVSNIINAIENSRHEAVTLANLIYAFGIPNIGLQAAKALAEYADNDPTVIIPALPDDFNLAGFGEVLINSFESYFADMSKFNDFKKVYTAITLKEPKGKTSNALGGLTFCCTGAVEVFNNRKELQAAIESRGGKFTTSVTSKTNYLITNDTTSGSAKNKAAQQLGIPILSEQDFISKFNITV